MAMRRFLGPLITMSRSVGLFRRTWRSGLGFVLGSRRGDRLMVSAGAAQECDARSIDRDVLGFTDSRGDKENRRQKHCQNDYIRDEMLRVVMVHIPSL
jgi:hypothetical protein